MTYDIDIITGTIAKHAAELADDAQGHLDDEVEHCPGWVVADVLQHLVEVYWFWTTVVAERLQDRPESGRPAPVERDELISTFISSAKKLVAALRDTNQMDTVYTWAPSQHNVAFVSRHQVQEIVVHHWDVRHATGRVILIEPDVAADSVDEFLTFSVSNTADPAEPPRPALGGPLALACSDVDASWTIVDDVVPGTIRFTSGVAEGVPVLTSTASDLLLWLYARLELSGDELAEKRGRRLQALTFTD
ncbi:MAG TPA: maleylpyruvate isomerase family mycothiol-dependent enzyme [Acidimicrobiales bacterium]